MFPNPTAEPAAASTNPIELVNELRGLISFSINDTSEFFLYESYFNIKKDDS